MKQILKAFVILAAVAAAGSAFATTIDSAGTQLGGGTFKPSNNVKVKVFTDANGTIYTAGSKHISGDKEYVTNNADARIYYKTLAVGTADPDFPASAAGETIGTTFTPL